MTKAEIHWRAQPRSAAINDNCPACALSQICREYLELLLSFDPSNNAQATTRAALEARFTAITQPLDDTTFASCQPQIEAFTALQKQLPKFAWFLGLPK